MSPINPQTHPTPNKNACRTGDQTASRGLLGRPSPLSVLFFYDMLNACMTLVLFVPCGPPPPHSYTSNLTVGLSLKLASWKQRDCSLRGPKAAMGVPSPPQLSPTCVLPVCITSLDLYTHTKWGRKTYSTLLGSVL